jgi:FHS family L-fucose permease-like MFS transporter
MVIKRKGYKIGVLVGLCLFSLGAFVFFPAAYQLSYPLFLIGLFTIGFGITFLETAANPLVTQFNIGKSDSFRLNLAQSFNGLGATLAGWMGGYLVFNTTQGATSSFQLAQSVVAPYLIIGGVVLLVAILFSKINLSTEVSLSPISLLPIRRHYFRWAMLAQFFYVGVQVGLGGFFIRYMCAYYDWSKEDAAYLFSFALLLFMLGRFLGTVLLNWITATKLLGIVSVLATFSCFLMFVQWLGWFPLLMVFLWMSIMFPTIFSLGVSSLPEEEKPLGSSLLIMTIVGGAVMPPLMGKVSDALGLNWAMLIPMMGFMVIFVFSFRKKDHV